MERTITTDEWIKYIYKKYVVQTIPTNRQHRKRVVRTISFNRHRPKTIVRPIYVNRLAKTWYINQRSIVI